MEGAKSSHCGKSFWGYLSVVLIMSVSCSNEEIMISGFPKRYSPCSEPFSTWPDYHSKHIKSGVAGLKVCTMQGVSYTNKIPEFGVDS